MDSHIEKSDRPDLKATVCRMPAESRQNHQTPNLGRPIFGMAHLKDLVGPASFQGLAELLYLLQLQPEMGRTWNTMLGDDERAANDWARPFAQWAWRFQHEQIAGLFPRQCPSEGIFRHGQQAPDIVRIGWQIVRVEQPRQFQNRLEVVPICLTDQKHVRRMTSA